MKQNDFFEAMNNIDPSLIERADKEVTMKKRRPMLKIAAVAASFAVLILGLAAVLPMLIGDEVDIPQDAIVWDNVFEMFDPDRGGGLKIETEYVLAEASFAEMTDAKYLKYKLGNCFPKDKGGEFIGEKLDDTEIKTGWHVYIEDKDRDVKTVAAEVYEIKGVAPDAAVAVKYAEKSASFSTDYYYVALNTEYGCDSLSEFLDDFNAAVHMDIGSEALLAEFTWRGDGESAKYRFTDGGASELCKLLLTLDGAAETESLYDEADEKAGDSDRVLRLTFAMNSAGRKTNYLYVFDSGYIAVRGIGEGVTFFNVGKEAVGAIFDSFEENAKLITTAVLDPNGDGLVEATTSAPENEIVPE